jgi:hypothetical protein
MSQESSDSEGVLRDGCSGTLVPYLPANYKKYSTLKLYYRVKLHLTIRLVKRAKRGGERGGGTK